MPGAARAVACTELALSVSGVHYRYGNKEALSGVDLSVHRGEVVMLIGPNGSGKTTLFSLICGLLSTGNGDIEICGKPAGRDPARLKDLGIVFQAPSLDLDLTVEQNLSYYAALHGLNRVHARTRIAAEAGWIGLSHRLKEKVRALNSGHRRRLEIARALLHQPPMLLLDEPTTGLDVAVRKQVIDSIRARAAQGHAGVLWATHLVDEVGKNDTVIVLREGQVVARGRYNELLKTSRTASLSDAIAALTS